MQATASIDYKSLYEASQLEIIQLKDQLQKFAALQLQTIGLQQQLSQLQKMIFGSRHERFVPAEVNTAQLSLDIQAEATATCSVVEAKKISYVRTNVSVEDKPLIHPGRMKLPEHLRREQIVIEPKEDISLCKKMGEEITEVLEYEPGELFVKKYVRIKYAKPDNEGVLIGKLPSRPLEKAMAGAGLLAQIVIDKYVDHLPLHRQMQRFERNGVKLPYSTLTDWVSATCKLIAPLYEALKAEVLKSSYLHADETPIKVLDKDKKGHTHRGYYWVYGNSIKKIVFFDYQQSRGREGPTGILENFRGYLQTDGYTAYEIFDRQHDISLMHCMAHARRMFHEALQNDEARASYALECIGKLYLIEKICKEQSLNAAEIKEVRRQKSVPILDSLGKWMKEQYMQVTPKSSIGKALAYSIERWKRLSLYTENGMLSIDNNPVENSIRPVAVGRKNYLFAGSHEAAQRSAMLYSLFGTCKMHGIEPYWWLRNVLETIADHPINRITELLPHRFKK
jgi:transposase